MNIVHKLVIDLQNNRSIMVELKKGGGNAYTLEMMLVSGGGVLDMSDIYTATIKAVKPDESIVYADAEIVKDENGNNTNKVVYVLSEAALSVTGKSIYEVMLMDSNGTTVNSFDFYVNVINQLYDENDLYDVSDVSGVRAYMARALRAAQTAEELENTFNFLYGSTEQVIAELNGEIDKYEEYFKELQERVDSGAFTGARGPQGENGHDAVVADATMIIGLQILDGDLICYYVGNEVPPVSINDDGELVMTYGE